MGPQIFVNLPVKDLNRSMTFFTGLGFTFDPRFTDENAGCMIVAENIYVMLLVEEFFQTFTKKPVSDAFNSTEVLVCLTCESREQVDDLIEKAVKGGGKMDLEPQEEGFMYQRSFEDPDGHIWELVYMEAVEE